MSRLNTNPVVFYPSAVAIAAFVLVGAVFPEFISGVFGASAAWISESLGWFYILAVTVFVFFVATVGFSRYGKLRLGPDGARPEFSNWAWFAMLFTAGIGSILMFYGASGPVSHFDSNPMGMTAEAGQVQTAINLELYHYGLHAWGVFGLAGLSLAYFSYRKGLPLRIRSAFYPIFGERIHGPVGHVIDIFTVLGTVFGVAVTLGLAGSQVNAGISSFTGLQESNLLQAGIIVAIIAVAIVSVWLGVDRGIRRLGQTNMVLAISLLTFVAVAGPTVYLLQGTVQNIGFYFQNFIQTSFWNQAYADTGWQSSWTVFIWAWQISWAPFIGMFVARISYGRTIREFVLGVLFAPLAFTAVWFSIFGGTALNLQLSGAADLVNVVVAEENTPGGLFAMLEQLPLASLTAVLAVVIVSIFFVTSADSASLVLDTLTSGDEAQESNPAQRIFWAASLGAIALVLLLADGLTALENVVTTTGLPFLLILTFMCYGLFKSLRSERLEGDGWSASQQTPADKMWESETAAPAREERSVRAGGD